MRYRNYKIISLVIASSLLSFSAVNAKNFTIYNAANINQPYFSVNGTSGNIGIGITNPSSPLQMLNSKWISAQNSTGDGVVNMFRVNSNNQIEVGAPLNIGSFEFSPDSGLVTFVDMPVTSAAPLGSSQSYVFKVDGDNLLTVYSESNGVGGVQNKGIGIGTITPGSSLEIKGAGSTSLTSALNVTNLAGVSSLFVRNDGNVGIGTTTPTQKLHVNGGAQLDAVSFGVTPGSTQTLALSTVEYVNAKVGGSAGVGTGINGQTLRHNGTGWIANSTLFNNGTNIGIGTTNPLNRFDIYNDSATYNPNAYNVAGMTLRTTAASGDFSGIRFTAAGARESFFGVVEGTSSNKSNFVFQGYDGTSLSYKEFMRINDTGNIGIGTTNPGAKLDVAGNTVLGASGATTVSLTMQSTTRNQIKFPNNSDLEFWRDGVEQSVTIKGNSGNVGIGTTTPTQKLHVAGGAQLDAVSFGVTPGSTQTLALSTVEYVNAKVGGSAGVGTGIIGQTLRHNGTGWVADSTLFNNATNVGIGTTNPGAPLQIGNGTANGNILYRGLILSGGWSSSAVRQQNLITFKATDNVNADPFLDISGEGVKNWHLGLVSNGTYNSNSRFSVINQGNERFTVANSGNVGIGTTVPGAKLDITNSGGIISRFTQTAGWTGSEYALYVSGYSYLNGFRVNAADGIRSLYKTAAGGSLGFATAGNDPITFTQSDSSERMRIAAGGNVGISTTTPTQKLHVAGGAQLDAVSFGVTPGSTQTLALSTVEYVNAKVGGSAGVGAGINGQTLRHNGTGWVADSTLFNNATNVGIGTTAPGAKLDVNGGAVRTNNQFISTVAIGTAPLAVTSNTVVSNLNSDLLDGYNASQLQFFQSNRDFVDGTLIESDIDYSVTSGEPFLLEIEGNSYGSGIPFDVKVQGYIYSDTIISKGGFSNGTNITGLVAFNYNGKLCFWFPRQAYWQGFSVFINSSYSGVKKNRLVAISSTAKPVAITKEVAFTISQSVLGGGTTNYLPKFTGVNTIGNSLVFDNGTNVGISATVPTQKLHVNGGAQLDAVSYGVTPGSTQTLALSTVEYVNAKVGGSAGVGAGINGQTLRHNGTGWVADSALFNSATNIGIGTTNPTAYLAGTNGLSIYNANFPGLGFGNTMGYWTAYKSGGDLRFYDNGVADRITFQSGGNVGIGTTNPTQKLSVSGNIYATGTILADSSITSNAGGLTFYQDGSYANLTGNSYTDTSWAGTRIAFNRTRGSRSVPTALVNGDVVGWFDYYGHDGSTTVRAGQFGLAVDGAVSAGIVPGRFYVRTANSAGANIERITFYSNDNISMAGSGGNVGIGAPSPTQKLHVGGGAQLDAVSFGVTPGSTQTLALSTVEYVNAKVGGSAGVGTGINGQTLRHNGTGWIADSTLFNNATNVGIGTTAPGYKLSVYDSSAVGGDRLLVGSAADNNGEYTGIRLQNSGIDNAAIRSFLQGGNPNSRLGFFVGDNTGNALSERLSIVSNGNVGIGTNAPSVKLDVAGAIAMHDENQDIDARYYGQTFLRGWQSFSAGSEANISYISDATSPVGNQVLEVSTTVWARGPKLPLDITQNYEVEMWIKRQTANTAGSYYFVVSNYDSNGTIIGGDGTDWHYPASGIGQATMTVGAWTKYRFVVGPYGGTKNHNATAKFISIGFLVNNGGGTDVIRLAGFKIKPLSRYNNDSLTITNSGNIGIGSTAPTQRLHVTGGAQLDAVSFGVTPGSTQTLALSTVEYVNAKVGGSAGVGAGTTGQTLRHDGTGWVANSTLFNNGSNIGVGTTNPTQQLEVFGANPRISSKRNTAAGNYASFLASSDTTSYPRAAFFIGDVSGDSIANAGFTIAPDVSTAVQKIAFLEIKTNPVNSVNSKRFFMRQGTTNAEFITSVDNGNPAGSPLVFTTQGFSYTSPGIYVSNVSGQNIGISTTTPTQKLHVAGGAQLDSVSFGVTPGSTQTLALSTVEYVNAKVGGSGGVGAGITGQTLRHNGTGWVANSTVFNNGTNVGIGTTAPRAKLDIPGGWASTLLSGDNVVVRKPNYAGGGWARNLMQFEEYDGTVLTSLGMTGSNNTVSNGYLGVAYNSTAMRWYPDNHVSFDNNVGIGITNPGQKLDVSGRTIIHNSGTLYNNAGSAELHVGYGLAAPSSVGSVTRLALQPYGHTGGPWKFDTRDTAGNAFLDIYYGTASTTGLTIVNGGNVGLSIANPSQKLHVAGGAQLDAISFGVTPGSTQTLALSTVEYVNAKVGGSAGVGTGTSGQTLRHNGTGWIANSIIFNNGTNVGIGATVLANKLDVTGNVGISGILKGYGAASNNFFEGKLGVNTLSSGASSLSVFGNASIGSGYLSNTAPTNGLLVQGNVGIGTTTPAQALHVAGNLQVDGGVLLSGNLTMASSTLIVNKITANTIDPLYTINGIKYSTYAPSIVGGVNEEYIGRIYASEFKKVGTKYEKIIDLARVSEGSDLWVWRKVVDFNDDNVEIFLSPRGETADMYAYITGEKIIIRSDKPVSASLRLVGQRYDWRQWPTLAIDQMQEGGLVVK